MTCQIELGDQAQAFSLAAEMLVGTPFRLHGRDPATGLDCVGVLSASLAAIGRNAPLPDTYTLRTRFIAGLQGMAHDCGLRPAGTAIQPGDVLFVRISSCQLHLLVAARNAMFVHAHAGLRRVILTGGPLFWPTIAHWRLAEPNQG